MIRTVISMISMLFLAFQISINNLYAQDYTQWQLPEDATARLGKGRILDMEYSPDGSILAVATTVGIWIYDTDTFKEQTLLPMEDPYSQKLHFNLDGSVLAVKEIPGDRITYWDVTLPKMKKTSRKESYFPHISTFSSDGNTYLTKTLNDIHVLDSKTNTSKHILKGHQDYIGCLAYSPDSKMIASGSDDQTIRLWDVKTGKHIRTLTGHENHITNLSFNPDGSTLISVCKDMTINFWDIASGEVKLQLAIQGVMTNKIEPKAKITKVFFSPKKNILATVDENRTIHLWNTTTGKLKCTFSDNIQNKDSTEHAKIVKNVLFSSDEKLVLSLVNDHEIRLWDIMSGKRIVFTGNIGHLKNAAFSPDGKTLVTGNYIGVIQIWDIESRKNIKTIPNIRISQILHNYREYNTYNMAFAQNGEKFITTELDGTIYLWDNIKKQLSTLREQNGRKVLPLNSVLTSPDGDTIATWSKSEDHTIQLWNAVTGKHKRTLKGYKRGNKRVVFSTDSSMLASWSSYDDTTIRLWNVATGRHKKTLKGHKNLIESVIFSPNGNTLISHGMNGTILIWDVKTGKHKKTLIDNGLNIKSGTQAVWTTVLEFNSDGETLASGDINGIIHLWDVSSWTKMKTLKGHVKAITSIKFSPDDHSLASTSKDGTTRLWNVDTCKEKQTLSGYEGTTWYVFFYPNGLPLVCEVNKNHISRYKEIVNLWDLRNGEKIKTLSGHLSWIPSISISRDGNILASVSFDGTVLLWDLTSIIQEFDVE
ncbi:hypothetical protein JT359_08175 [Candidatus Poribacteria bacterium]|nr:hypothetical protein [Candidatus Poribacteria bacterium]